VTELAKSNIIINKTSLLVCYNVREIMKLKF